MNRIAVMGRNSRISLAILIHLPSQLVRAHATHPANGGGFHGTRRCPGKFCEAIYLVESYTKVEQRRRWIPRLGQSRQRWLSVCPAGAWLARLVGVRHGSHNSAFK
jgi:hypothetical protein